MRYIYQRGSLSRARRKMHICGHDPMTGEATMEPLCGERRIAFNTSINPPWSLGLGVCKHCEAKVRGGQRGE